jgi:hypothetical protein
MHNAIRKNKIRRKDANELDPELRPVDDRPDPDLPQGSVDINKRFVAFGGNPQELNDAASIASAGLVIAEQIAELTTAIHTLTFLFVADARRT